MTNPTSREVAPESSAEQGLAVPRLAVVPHEPGKDAHAAHGQTVSCDEVIPDGDAGAFILRDHGVFFQNPDHQGTAQFVCSYIKVKALARNKAGEEWSILVELKDPDEKLHDVFLPMRLLASDGREYRAELKSRGLRMAYGREANSLLHRYLNFPCNGRIRSVPRTGWHNDQFVLPDQVFGEASNCDPTRLQKMTGDSANYSMAGDLAAWQKNIAALCVGNSRLAFAISCALAGPLLRLANQEGGGFHLRGSSSLGKTTALIVAGSVFGGGGGKPNINTWRTTDNALKATAAAHCDATLLLDELGQVDAKVVGNVAYMLGNGVGKKRSSAEGSARQTIEWLLLYLSTGEQSICSKMAEAGTRSKAGQELRMAEIPADAGSGLGLFENLHGSKSPQDFACRLRKASLAYYGYVFREYLSVLATDLPQIKAWVNELIEQGLHRMCPASPSGQVARVARRFALLGAAGQIATELDLLPWPRDEAMNAAVTCFAAWLEDRGTLGSSERAEHIRVVKQFIEAHGSSRFENIGDTNETGKTYRRVGWRRKNEKGIWEYLILPEIFQS